MKLSPFLFLASTAAALAAPPLPTWRHLSSRRGELPEPNGGTQQTAAITFDIDGDGAADMVIAERTRAPSLTWTRFTGSGWQKHIIDGTPQVPEAGGAFFDVDGDGDPDLIIGGDYRSDELWWYENPRPDDSPTVPWKRHLIKKGHGNQHHDQAVADFLGFGRPQIIFWNQGARKLLLAEPPADPRAEGPWPLIEVLDTRADPVARKQEGMAVADIDGDGKPDLVAGVYWFKHLGGHRFQPVRVSPQVGRLAAGRFKPGCPPQIVVAPGDGDGPLLLLECGGNPLVSSSWTSRDLLGSRLVHGHCLEVADINGDGHLDIFCGEMGKWTHDQVNPDHPDARAWILYGDGGGNFHPTLFFSGICFHESRVADVNGDGRLDIMNKPYRWDTPRLDVWLNQGSGDSVTASTHREHFSGTLGMELWTYRRAAQADLPATLQLIRGLGLEDIETSGFYGRSAAEFRVLLDQAGLTCRSLISSYERLSQEPEAVAADARTVGAEYVIVAGIPRKANLTLDETRQAAADFNRWGRLLGEHGLRFGYHPHGFEFVPFGDGTLFDLLLQETLPELVTFELDIFWFSHAGADPVAYLNRWPGRFELMHLKDMQVGTPTGVPTGKAPRETNVALGAGRLPMSDILRAAAKAGVKRYYIEDESPRAAQQVPASLRYLGTVRF